jgi:hypothetical protein
MMLLTKAIKNKIPALYSQENIPDPIVHVKFFDPTGSFTWFATEFDGEDQFFGKVFSEYCPEGELGYFSLSELQNTKVRLGLGIERDLHFHPKPLSQITQSS